LRETALFEPDAVASGEVPPAETADFLAPRANLMVEVDGPCHLQRRTTDSRRDRKLARLGYRVLRLQARLVLEQLPVAPQCIRRALSEGG